MALPVEVYLERGTRGERRGRLSLMPQIAQEDLIQSVADALQFISY